MGVTPVWRHLLSVLEECVTALAELLWRVKHLDPNHLEPFSFELNVHLAFPGALSAPFQSTGSLPSCIQQCGSRAPWRSDTKHTQAANSCAELLCSVDILSHRNRTVEVKKMYNLQRFWNTTLLLYERTYSFKQDFV